MKAYIIQKIWRSDDNKQQIEVVSILSHRRHTKFVQEYLKQLHADLYASYDLEHRLARVKYSNPKNDVFSVQRVGGDYIIGHEIQLILRRVDNIRIEVDGDGNEKLVWDEIDRSKYRKFPLP